VYANTRAVADLYTALILRELSRKLCSSSRLNQLEVIQSCMYSTGVYAAVSGVSDQLSLAQYAMSAAGAASGAAAVIYSTSDSLLIQVQTVCIHLTIHCYAVGLRMLYCSLKLLQTQVFLMLLVGS
jgi:hypothetical protein